MFRLKESIHVNAPLDRCFLLSTNLELVRQTIQLNPVEGKTSGLVVGGDELVWRGWKFGLPAMHETLITAYERPKYFQDTMGRGRFRSFQHDHHFEGYRAILTAAWAVGPSHWQADCGAACAEAYGAADGVAAADRGGFRLGAICSGRGGVRGHLNSREVRWHEGCRSA
jgi:hypothetical protein